MDYATRFPDAFPMKNQDAESVANALIEMFSRVGFPKEILSDQGTNFMSSLISELCKMLKVRKMSTTSYHPQANGLVERFNGTLKQMLKAYAVVEPLKWDVHLPYVLFAYREVPNETTGFTPFELLYARHVRGPLYILKEQWEEPTEKQTSVLSYLMETRERMETVRKMVTDMESLAKKNQKRYYDKNARNRNFEVGQKVLVLLPTSTSKLLAQWKGPYEVTQIVEAIQNFPIPTTKKKVKSFLGMIGFYRKFIPNFATVALPLTDLTKKRTPNKIKWTDDLDHSFKELKGKLLSEPVLRSPDFSRSFILRTDASAHGAGAVLEQEFEDGKHPICFLSKKFSPAERNYAVVEKECLAIVWAVQSLRVYLEDKPFEIETDHAPLQWLQRSKLSNQRLLSWSLLLQEFVFSIRYIRSTQNSVADSLSRMCSDDAID